MLYLDTVRRALAGRLYRPVAVALRALQLRAARERAGAARAVAGRPDRGTDAWRESRAWSAISSSRRCSTSRATPARRGQPAAGRDRAAWAASPQRLGIKVIHIAERDTQVADRPKQPGEFVNTWSVDGFVGEGCQPAELGWGTHEKALPADGRRHECGCDAAIYLLRPGRLHPRAHLDAAGRPLPRLPDHPQREHLDRRLLHGARADGSVAYRPTAHYAYHPCDDAVLSVHELAGKNWQMQPEKRLMTRRDHPRHGRARRAADGPCARAPTGTAPA